MHDPTGRIRRLAALSAGALVALMTVGCQSPPTGPTSLRIAPGSYSATFQAVKDELRSSGFELDRIDARAGVITTRPRASAGLATPWITDESTIEQEFEGALNRQQRTVTVRFAPTAQDDTSDAFASDLRDAEAEEAPMPQSEVRKAQREADRKAEVDRVLEEIAREGMGSLTKKERKVLQMETEAKKREE